MGSQEHAFAPSLKSTVLAECQSATRADGLDIVPDGGRRQRRFSEYDMLKHKDCKILLSC